MDNNCVARKALIEAFEARFYARGDHRYSGIEILMWIWNVDYTRAIVAIEERRVA